MPALQELLAVILQGLGIMAGVAVAFGALRRLNIAGWQRELLIGLLLGAAAVVMALSPARLALGVDVDGRFVMIGLAGAFGGLPALLTAGLLNGAARLAMQQDAALTIVGPFLSGCMGLIWHMFIRKRFGTSPQTLVLLGLMLSAAILLYLSLPLSAAPEQIRRGWPVTIVIAIITAVCAGMLLNRETVQIEREKLLREAALRDALTGLHNRRSFDVELAAAAAQPGSLCVLVVDVDHFKSLNDRYGHATGDKALQALAQTMQTAVRADDVVGRIGGEEFGIVLKNTERADAYRLAARLLERVQALKIVVDQVPISFTVSIGGTVSGTPTDPQVLMTLADVALYRAKQAGRNCIAFDQGPPPTESSETLDGAAAVPPRLAPDVAA